MQTDLKDKVVLITGASGGIGQATARAFAEEGAILGLHFHENGTAASRLREELPDARAVTIQADLSNEAAVDAMFEKLIGEFGRIDAIVVNAGTWLPERVPLHRMSLNQWRTILDADLTSAFLTCRGYLRHLEEHPRANASIVMVGSTAAMVGEADNAEYSAAKAGMVWGLTLSLKNEIVRLAPLGRVNAVCPGWVSTPAAMASLPDQKTMDLDLLQ